MNGEPELCESNDTRYPSIDGASPTRHIITNIVQSPAEPPRANSYPKENNKPIETTERCKSHCILNSHYCNNKCPNTCTATFNRYSAMKPYAKPVVVTESLLDRISERLWGIYDSYIKRHQ